MRPHCATSTGKARMVESTQPLLFNKKYAEKILDRRDGFERFQKTRHPQVWVNAPIKRETTMFLHKKYTYDVKNGVWQPVKNIMQNSYKKGQKPSKNVLIKYCAHCSEVRYCCEPNTCKKVLVCRGF